MVSTSVQFQGHPCSKKVQPGISTLLEVQNLECSVDFYTQIFQVDIIPYPFPPSPEYKMVWVGTCIELHLSQWINSTTKS